MPAESLYGPIPIEKVREARARLALAGHTIETWSAENGFPATAVYNVLGRRVLAIRGKSWKIAIALGLRPHPEAPAAPAPAALSPAPAPAQFNRNAKMKLGEAAR